MLTLLFSAVLYAFSLSAVFTQVIINKFNINLFGSDFSLSIPSFTQDLGLSKTYDIVYFVLAVLFSLLTSFFYFLIIKYSRNTINSSKFIDRLNLFFSLLLFLQTHFVRYSGKALIITFILSQTIFLFSKLKLNLKDLDRTQLVIWANGFIAGFYFMLFVRHFSTSMIVVIGTILLVIFVYGILGNSTIKRYLSSPFHLIMFLSIFASWNTYYLVFLGLLSLFCIITITRLYSPKGSVVSFLYVASLIIFLSYNPIFYFGNIDSVEEGFWLGWLQRLLEGQVLYRDVALFHPPFLVWGLSFFTRIFGISIYDERLYFQILKIIGILIIYFVYRKLIKNKTNLFLAVLILFSVFTPYVRNNVEVRLGAGLISLFFLSLSFETKRLILLPISGLLAATSVFISIESGIASLISGFIGLIFYSKGVRGYLKNLLVWLLGALLIFGIVAIILYSQRALADFFQQMTFYSNAFSSGYFNIPIERPELQNIFQMWRFDRYLFSDSALWQITFLTFGLAASYSLYTLMNLKTRKADKFSFLVLIFSFVLSRAALGRSDLYHLLFILVPTLPVFVVAIESLEESRNVVKASSIVLLFLLVFVYRGRLLQVFLNDQIFKLQSYANISQRYEKLNTNRANIALDIDAPVFETDSLIKYIGVNTKESDKIFVYPWAPELYFLADRKNSTQFDTPYSFFTEFYQQKMISQLQENPPKYVIYNSNVNFGGMTAGSLSKLNEYLKNNFEETERFGNSKILIRKIAKIEK